MPQIAETTFQTSEQFRPLTNGSLSIKLDPATGKAVFETTGPCVLQGADLGRLVQWLHREDGEWP